MASSGLAAFEGASFNNATEGILNSSYKDAILDPDPRSGFIEMVAGSSERIRMHNYHRAHGTLGYRSAQGSTWTIRHPPGVVRTGIENRKISLYKTQHLAVFQLWERYCPGFDAKSPFTFAPLVTTSSCTRDAFRGAPKRAPHTCRGVRFLILSLNPTDALLETLFAPTLRRPREATICLCTPLASACRAYPFTGGGSGSTKGLGAASYGLPSRVLCGRRSGDSKAVRHLRKDFGPSVALGFFLQT